MLLLAGAKTDFKKTKNPDLIGMGSLTNPVTPKDSSSLATGVYPQEKLGDILIFQDRIHLG